MKMKWVFTFVVLAGLTVLSTGCLTSAASTRLVQTKADWFFSPVAFYRSTADGSLAIEGTLRRQSGPPTHTYLVVPRAVLTAAHLKTGGDISFRDIASLSNAQRKKLFLRTELSGDFDKIGDVSGTGMGVDLNERKTVNLKVVGWLPFAVAIDAATFPLQVYLYEEMGKNFRSLN